MTELMELLKVYKDFGAATLFLALYIITVFFFYKELKNSKDEMVRITERLVTALDNASEAGEKTVEILKNVGFSLDKNTVQTGEFIAFVKGRDSSGRN